MGNIIIYTPGCDRLPGGASSPGKEVRGMEVKSHVKAGVTYSISIDQEP